MLVLERRERLGGACTLEQPFADPGYAVSPCAYVVGLLDQRVIDELALRRHGYKVFVAEPAIWCPFDDGTWYAQFLDHERTAAGMRENGFSEADIKGQFEYEDFFDRMRRAPARGRPRHAGSATRPTRPSCASCSATTRSWSTRCSRPRSPTSSTATSPTPGCTRRCTARASSAPGPGPRTPGTASIKLMHFQGTLEGVPMAWGYVEGGMGRISFAIAEAAREAGAVLAAGVPVAEIRPGEGVVLEGGELIRARAVVSNADPVVTGRAARRRHRPGASPARVDGWRTTSPVVKVNCGLSRLPRWTAVPDAELAERRAGVDRAADRRRPAGVRGLHARHPVARLRRAVLPDRVRPDRRPAGQAHDVGVRAVRAVRAGRRHVGRPARRDRPAQSSA